MTFSKNIFVATALAGIFCANAASEIRAADSSLLTMKPLHGISHDVGTKRAVSYFLSDNGKCKLVLTLAEAPNWDEVPNLIATRFEAAIDAGKTTRFHATAGKSLQFACQAGAQAMNVKVLDQVATVDEPVGRRDVIEESVGPSELIESPRAG